MIREMHIHKGKKFINNELQSITHCVFVFISEVHFQLYENVFKKVQDKNLLQKLLIQKNYPHEV